MNVCVVVSVPKFVLHSYYPSSCIGIHDQKNESCIEELSNEHSPYNFSFLITNLIIANPLNKRDDGRSENQIHADNDEWNWETKQ